MKKKIVIVVYGKDRTGIIYNITKILYEYNLNVFNIKQAIVAGYFNMMAISEAPKEKEFSKLKSDLEDFGKKTNLSINVMLEDAFNAMHQI